MCRTRTWQLRCSGESVTAGRHHAVHTLASWGVTAGDPACAALDDIALVLTELLTNAVKHCRSSFTLSLIAHRRAVVVMVSDEDQEFAERLEPPPLAEAGRGLQIVATVGRQWGQTAWERGAKQVWCEIAVPEGSALADGCRL